MSFFSVRIEELHQLRTRLQSCTEDMRSAAGELQGSSPGQLGTAGLDEACADFGDTWGHGIDRIAEGAKRIDEAMRRACDAYAGTEEAVARMYGAGGGNGSGGGHG